MTGIEIQTITNEKIRNAALMADSYGNKSHNGRLDAEELALFAKEVETLGCNLDEEYLQIMGLFTETKNKVDSSAHKYIGGTLGGVSGYFAAKSISNKINIKALFNSIPMNMRGTVLNGKQPINARATIMKKLPISGGTKAALVLLCTSLGTAAGIAISSLFKKQVD